MASPFLNPKMMRGLLGNAYIDPQMGAFQGASQAIAPYAGYTLTPTNIGQVLGAAGGGAMRGQMGANQQNTTLAGVAQKLRAAEIAKEKAVQLQGLAEGMAKKADVAGDPQTAMMWRTDPEGMMAHLQKMKEVDPRRGMSGAAKYALDMGEKPGTLKYLEAMQTYLRKSTMTVNMGGVNNVLDTVATAGFKDSLKGAADAGQKLFQMNEMKTLLSSGVPTGKLASATLGVRNFLGDFGYKDPNMGVQEALQSLGNELALGKHGPGMGPMTDADFKVYQGIVPGLKGTEAGNALIMQRVVREQMGRQMLSEVYKEQLSKGGAKAYSPAKAWREVAKRLDAKIGPLIPQVKSLKEAEAKPQYVNKVVMVDGKPYFVKK